MGSQHFSNSFREDSNGNAGDMINAVSSSVTDEGESRQPSLSESIMLSDAALNFISSQKNKHKKHSSVITGSSGQRIKASGTTPSVEQEQRDDATPFDSVTYILPGKTESFAQKEPSSGRSSGQHFVRNTLLRKFGKSGTLPGALKGSNASTPNRSKEELSNHSKRSSAGGVPIPKANTRTGHHSRNSTGYFRGVNK